MIDSVLIPYDASEPSAAALTLGIELARHGSTLVIVNVVDEAGVIAETASTISAYDPTPLLEALDSEGRALLAEAEKQCREAGATVTTEIVHDTTIAGILGCADKHGSNLIVMGTHARSGVARTFLGSTTEGVLRASHLPVLTVRAHDAPAASPFAKALVAVDDSEPSDAAIAVAGELAQKLKTQLALCTVIDLTLLYENAANYGYDPTDLTADIRAEAKTLLENALKKPALQGLAVETQIVEGKPDDAIASAAHESGAGLIVVGSHGRRGLRRLFLGSVAEHVVRTADVPVLVARTP